MDRGKGRVRGLKEAIQCVIAGVGVREQKKKAWPESGPLMAPSRSRIWSGSGWAPNTVIQAWETHPLLPWPVYPLSLQMTGEVVSSEVCFKGPCKAPLPCVSPQRPGTGSWHSAAKASFSSFLCLPRLPPPHPLVHYQSFTRRRDLVAQTEPFQEDSSGLQSDFNRL